MKQLTQHEKILNFMQSNGGITCVDAFKNGITQLAARIKELKEIKGYNIGKKKIEHSRIERYYLVKE